MFVKDKLAIITSGGGMKCSFGAGVMLALAEEFKIKKPQILISCSGSAGTGSYYVSQQYKSIRNIWENLLSTSKLINHFRFWKIIDIDYLIDEVFRKQDPLDSGKIASSKTHYLIPALNREKGKIDYFSNRDRMDVFKAMRVTKALPIAFGLNPKVAISKSTYCDSCLTSAAKSHIEKAVELEAKKILIVDNSVQGLSEDFEQTAFNLWFSFQNTRFKVDYSKAEKMAEYYKHPQCVEVLTIMPKKPLKIKTLENNKNLLSESVQQGYDETCSNKKLINFLASS